MGEFKLNNKGIEKPSASLYYQKPFSEHEELKSLNVNLKKKQGKEIKGIMVETDWYGAHLGPSRKYC